MHTVADTLPAVKTRPAYEAYRAHLFSDCDRCAGGHFCFERNDLDYLADVEAFAVARLRELAAREASA